MARAEEMHSNYSRGSKRFSTNRNSSPNFMDVCAQNNTHLDGLLRPSKSSKRAHEKRFKSEIEPKKKVEKEYTVCSLDTLFQQLGISRRALHELNKPLLACLQNYFKSVYVADESTRNNSLSPFGNA